MPDELKPVLARQMEVYAGFLEHTDHHVGRLIDAIEDLGVLDDTIIYYIIGDNGASAEGTMNGAFNEMANFNGMAALETPEFMLSKMDEFGSPDLLQPLLGRLGVGDEHARSSGPSRSPRTGAAPATAPSCTGPNGIEEPGGLRSQFTHVIDVAPTILEAAGLPEPTMVNGVQQSPMEGTSMLYTFNDADAPGAPRPAVLRDVRQPRHLPPGLERGHQAPHALGHGRRRRCPPFDDDVWELYDGSSDYSQARDLAAEHPEMLAKLQRLWLIEADEVQRAADGRPQRRAARARAWPGDRP